MISFLALTVAFGAFAGGAQEESSEVAARAKYYNDDVYQVVSDIFFETESPVYGGTLRRVLSSAPQSFNPFGTLDGSTYAIMFDLVLSPLVTMNPANNELEPGLAKSWDISNDGKTVTFHLRDVEWSDGEKFTADDVIFSLETFTLNKFAEGNQIARFTINGELVEFSKVDDMTVQAVLPATYGPFLSVLTAAYIAPRHKVESLIDPDDPGSVNNIWTTDTDLSEIVGTGHFVLSDYVVDQKVTLTANPKAWHVDPQGNPLPYVDTLEFLILSNKESHAIKLQSGEIDYLDSVNTADYPTLKTAELDGAPIKVFAAQPTKPTPSPLHLAFNFDAEGELGKLFSNEKFRQAMEYVVNRERVIEEVYDTLAVLGGVPVLPANTPFYNPEIEKIRRPYDLEASKALLAEIGLKDSDNDGVLEFSNGEKVEFVLTTVTGTQGDAALIFSEDAAKVGVKVDIQIIDGSLRGGKVLGGDYQASLWAFGNQPDPQLRKAIWQPGRALYYAHPSTMDKETKEPVMENITGWERKVFDLFEAGQVEMDPAKRKEIYGEWQAIYAEKVPFIYICKGMSVLAASDNVGNFIQDEMGAMAFTPYTVFKK